MKSGLWKRAGVALVAGALAWISYSPAMAAPLDLTGSAPGADVPGQVFGGFGGFGGGGACFPLGGVGLAGSAVQAGFPGAGALGSFGSGGFYGPYYEPAYGNNGYGFVGAFLNYTGGQPTAQALLAGSPQCVGQNLATAAPTATTAPFVISNLGAIYPSAGFVGAGFGTGFRTGFNTFGTGFNAVPFNQFGVGQFGVGFGLPGPFR
jgi:hypothetical protein